MSHSIQPSNALSSTLQKFQLKFCNNTVLKTLLVVFGILLVGGAIAAQVCQVDSSVVFALGGTGGACIGIASMLNSFRDCIPCLRPQKRRVINTQEPPTRQLAGLPTQSAVSNYTQQIHDPVQQKTDALNLLIAETRQHVEKWKKIFNNPAEPIEDVGFMGVEIWTNKPHQEKIDLFWKQIKSIFRSQDYVIRDIKSNKLDQNPTIQEQLHLLSALTNECVELRRDTYHAYIKTLGNTELLKEAQKYYVAEQQTVKIYTISYRVGPSLEEIQKYVQKDTSLNTLGTLFPKLSEQLHNLKNIEHFESYKIEIEVLYQAIKEQLKLT